MNFNELMQHFEGKSQQEVADFFGVEQPAVASWKAKDRVPPRRVAEFRLRQLTNSIEAPESTPCSGIGRSS